MEAEAVHIQKHLVGIEYLLFNPYIAPGETIHRSRIYTDRNTCFTFRSNWNLSAAFVETDKLLINTSDVYQMVHLTVTTPMSH